jgi:2-polyprenyl-3-methyl-5-hydroxy-6-metoxy-1,4-benzoquinol methylase
VTVEAVAGVDVRADRERHEVGVALERRLDRAPQAVAGDEAVVVQRQDVVAARRGEAVVEAADARVHRALDDLDVGELLAHHRGRSVAGGVVDDDHVDPVGGIVRLGHLAQAAAQVVAPVEHQEDDRDGGQGHGRHRLRSRRMTDATASALRAEVERLPWYHTLELGDGVVTPGMFDHRPVLGRYLLPDDLTGKRCLDVATMDGFWAFEMERRGAASVVALDLEDPEELDWPAVLRAGHDKSMDATKAERFALASNALGSKVERVLLSAYDLGPELGTFDFVFCGDLLLHLKDPITPVENIRSVCAADGSAVIVNVIKRSACTRSARWPSSTASTRSRGGRPTSPGLVRIVRAAGFSRVRPASRSSCRSRDGGDWRGLRGVVRAYP